VLNGLTTAGEQYRWVIKYGDCSGALLTDRIVITAGHCINPQTIDIEITDYVYDLVQKKMVQKTLGYVQVEKSWSKFEMKGNAFDGAILLLNEPVSKKLVSTFPKLATQQERKELKNENYFVSKVIGYGFFVKQGEIMGQENFGYKTQAVLTARHWSFLSDLILATMKMDANSRSGDWYHYASENKAQIFGDSGGPTLAMINGEWKLLGITHTLVMNPWAFKKMGKTRIARLHDGTSMDVQNIICTAKSESDIPEIQSLDVDCD
jgi:hypothetical protein